MKKHVFVVFAATVMMTLAMGITSFAGEWKWMDVNGDGISECYYMENGAALTGSITPDGYTVNEAGAWEENGVVQTRPVQADEAYDRSLSRFGSYDTGAMIVGNQIVDCGDYYSVEYEAYWGFDPENNMAPDETGIARVRKSAVVHWNYYSDKEQKMTVQDITLEEYANWYNYTESKQPLRFIRMWGVTADTDGYVVAFSDVNGG